MRVIVVPKWTMCREAEILSGFTAYLATAADWKAVKRQLLGAFLDGAQIWASITYVSLTVVHLADAEASLAQASWKGPRD